MRTEGKIAKRFSNPRKEGTPLHILILLHNFTCRKAKLIWNNFETPGTPSFLFWGQVYMQSHWHLGKQMWSQLNKTFFSKIRGYHFSGRFRLHISVNLGTFHFLRLYYFATLFRHCLSKLIVQFSMGICKIVTVHFWWGLKWEGIAPDFISM